jgi:hypothetical protein
VADNVEIEDLTSVKTGVFTINRVPNIFDDIAYYSINIDFDVRQEEIEKEYHEKLREEHNLPEDYDFDADPQEVMNDFDLDDYMNEEDGADTRLIGFMKDEEGLYIEDPKAEYSCIIGESYGQVTQSLYICQCNHCSPCYPYQGDLETEGDEWAFTLPPDVWGDDKPDHMKIYKLDHKIENLTGICADLAKKGVFIPIW